MNIISKYTADNIAAAILEDLIAHPGWNSEGEIHQRITGYDSGAWEHFGETLAVLAALKDEGKIIASGNNGFNSFSFKLA